MLVLFTILTAFKHAVFIFCSELAWLSIFFIVYITVEYVLSTLCITNAHPHIRTKVPVQGWKGLY